MKKGFRLKNFLLGIFSVGIIYIGLIGLALGTIPERVYIPLGNNVDISYRVPLTADIEEGFVEVLSNSQERLTENIHFDLSTPFSVSTMKTGTLKARVSLLGIIPIKTIAVDVIENKEVIPCGNIVGVTINTDGILVLGTGKLKNTKGELVSPSRGLIKSGDIIRLVDSRPIKNKEELISLIKDSKGEEMVFSIIRDNKSIEVNISPTLGEDSTYKLGLWVRDSTQGLGTITYFDTNSLDYAALGHGIYDVDTNTLLSVKEGGITRAGISGVRRGESGKPGEVMGTLDKAMNLGTITNNTDLGLFGVLNEKGKDYLISNIYPIGMRYEIEEGEATIKTDIIGGKIEEYKINIDSIDLYGGNTNKSMIITVTDERLLSETGGIIQGMSGSPIIQKGKLVGAITHVFVQRPNKGYGIFIENMLNYNSRA